MEGFLSQESFSPRPTDESQGDPWENVPTPKAFSSDESELKEMFFPRSGAAEKLRRLGSKYTLLERSSTVQVIYKLEVPVGKEETFVAAFWKQERVLRDYATEVTICKSAERSAPAASASSASSSGAPANAGNGAKRALNLAANDSTNGAATSSTSMNVLAANTAAVAAATTVAAASSVSSASSGNSPVIEASVPLPLHACKVCKAESRSDPCTEYIAGPLRRVKDSDEVGLTQSQGGTLTEVSSSSDLPGSSPHTGAPSGVAPSPLGKSKPVRSGSSVSWGSQIARFVERRCRTCGHLALDHTIEGKTVTYVLYMEFKTRAVFESAFAHPEDVASEGMKNCIARLYEPSVMELLDEQECSIRDDDSVIPASSDEDVSATESMDEMSEAHQRPAFRLSLWKAQNLPKRSDGTPHTWVVQAKFGKSILTSSAKTSNDPVWKQHFHFRYKPGRKLHLRIAATDEPREHLGKLKINVKHSAARSRSHSSNASSLGRKTGPDFRRSVELRHSDNRRQSSELMEDTEEPADELWKSARQWRDIEPKEKGTKHGQMLLSLEMNVSIVDSLALYKPVLEEEPDGVGDVIPPSSKWDLFSNLEKGLQTGDVVLFVGHGWVGSTVQKYQERTWVHFGMIMVFPEYDMILVWELMPSKSLEVSSKRTGQVKLVVQLTDINQKLRDGRYHRVAVRKLECKRSQEQLQGVMQLKKHLEVQGYTAVLNHLADKDDDLSAHFSAELVSLAFQKMGLLPSHVQPTDLGPQFWLKDGDIALEDGAVLKPCVLVERTYEPMSKTYVVKEAE